jgi:TPR repeat protein
MNRCKLTFIGCLFFSLWVCAQPSTGNPVAPDQGEQMLREEKHFIEALGYVYNPALWISYRDGLYFAVKSDAQAQQLETLKTALANYVALTNRQARHDLAAKVIAESGIDAAWQRKILLPYSETNQNLTPTLDKPVQVVPDYKLLRSLADGDALIEAQEVPCLVMNFSGGTNVPPGSEAWLIKEGEKAYATAPGEYQRVEAFTDVRLRKEETAVLNRVATACRKKAAALATELRGVGAASQEFENSLRRATDNNPFLQYQVAKAYLEGKGTRKDETLGMQWMNKAAKNGSGDARSYLDSLGRKTPGP